MEIDNSLSHTVAEGGRKKFQHDFDEVNTNVCRWTLAQSICDHYSSLSGRPDMFLGSETSKKSGPR